MARSMTPIITYARLDDDGRAYVDRRDIGGQHRLSCAPYSRGWGHAYGLERIANRQRAERIRRKVARGQPVGQLLTVQLIVATQTRDGGKLAPYITSEVVGWRGALALARRLRFEHAARSWGRRWVLVSDTLASRALRDASGE